MQAETSSKQYGGTRIATLLILGAVLLTPMLWVSTKYKHHHMNLEHPLPNFETSPIVLHFAQFVRIYMCSMDLL